MVAVMSSFDADADTELERRREEKSRDDEHPQLDDEDPFRSNFGSEREMQWFFCRLVRCEKITKRIRVRVRISGSLGPICCWQKLESSDIEIPHFR